MKIIGQIPRVKGSELSYAEFREKYMMTNEPVILTGLMDGWRACTDWVSQDGQPNLSFFSTHFGISLVQVADCDRKEFTDQKRMEMTVLEYIEYWHNLDSQRYKKHTVYDIYGDVCTKQFPGFPETSWLECVQERNEIIFVPSGWYHQVKNVEDTISINHNWFNACNISWVWDLLVKDYNETKEYIEDIRSIADDFEGLCQRNLAANTGMNFNDFFVFIAQMALANVTQLIDILDFRNSMEPSEMEKVQQLLFNLASICNVAKKMEIIDYFDGYSREHTFDLQERAILYANLEISKDFNIHELKESWKENFSFLHNANVANTSTDLVDEVQNNETHSAFQGSEKKICLKTNERKIIFSDEIFSVMLKDHSTEKYRVNIANPQHLVQIINNIITSVKERAYGVVT